MSTLEVTCPCCGAALTVDVATGSVVFHVAKKVADPKASFDDLLGDLAKKKVERDKVFEKEMGSQKDRERLLDEKFEKAKKDAEERKDESRPLRDIDL